MEETARNPVRQKMDARARPSALLSLMAAPVQVAGMDITATNVGLTGYI